jgi:hypothetical protein
MAYLCSLVMILMVTPGRIPKPCVVGSNPTGGAEYLPLSSRIPSVTCGHLDHPTRPARRTSRGFMPSTGGWATRRGSVSTPRQARTLRRVLRTRQWRVGLLIAQPIRHFRDLQMSRPSGQFNGGRRDQRERTIPLCVCPMHLNYPAAGCANEFQTFGRKPPLKFLGVGACRLG